MIVASATAVDFFSGAAAMASAVAALFFLRFWRRSGDRFFALFALAFGAFAANRLVLVFVHAENRAYVYVIRLVAFVLILIAIVDKNRAD